MRVHVEVTQEDINDGCRFDSVGKRGGCMVHRAFMRATEGAFAGCVTVLHDEIRLRLGERLISLPHWQRKRIHSFDMGLHVDPFSFDIDIPDEALA